MTLLTTLMPVPFITDDVVHRKEIARWMAALQPTLDAMASLSAVASFQPWIVATQPPYNMPHDGTDIVPALSAIAADAGSGGAVVLLPSLPGYFYKVAQPVTIARNIQLRGTHVFNGVPGTNAATDYNTINGRLYVSAGATITLKGNSGIDGMLMMRSGLTPPVNDSSAFAGLCVQIAEDDAFVTHCQIMGFDQAIYSTNAQRPIVAHNTFDNRNNVQIEACADIAKVHANHAWPFATIAGAGGVPGLHRNGASYKFNDLCDWAKVTDNFCYGYLRGYYLSSVSNVTLMGNGADNTRSFGGSIAFEIKGNCGGTVMVGCQAAAQDHGIHISTSAAFQTTISEFSGWGNTIEHIRLDKGRAHITDSWMRDAQFGVTVNFGAAGFATIDDCWLESQTSQPIACNVSTSCLTIGNLRLTGSFPTIVSNHLLPDLSVSTTLTTVVAHNRYELLGSGTVEAALGTWAGREVTFIVNANTVTFKHGFGQYLLALDNGVDFVASNAAALTLINNGSQWIEKSRKR